jgi:opacity protein-like surface antigen
MNKHNWPQRVLGEKINQTIFSVLVTLPMLFSGNSLASNDFEEKLNEDVNVAAYQPYFSLGVSYNKLIDIPGFKFKQQNLSTSFGLGLIKIIPLNNDWEVSQSIELNYATSQFSGNYRTDNTSNAFSDGRLFDVDGKYQEIALIGSIKVKKLHVFENISPYIEASVGLINAKNRFDSPLESKNDRQWKLGYKLSTGVAFDIGEGNSIAFGIGFSDNSDI